MKEILHDNHTYILRFDAGDEAIKSLKNFCVKEGIGAAEFSGIGSCDELTLSYYDLGAKEYKDTEINDRLEVASLLGNVSKMSGETVVHAHGVFGDSKLNARAGHVKKMVVSATCEITLTTLAGTLERKPDPETGLNLLD